MRVASPRPRRALPTSNIVEIFHEVIAFTDQRSPGRPGENLPAVIDDDDDGGDIETGVTKEKFGRVRRIFKEEGGIRSPFIGARSCTDDFPSRRARASCE